MKSPYIVYYIVQFNKSFLKMLDIFQQMKTYI